MRLARCGVRDVAPLKQLAAVMFSLAMAYVSPAAAQCALPIDPIPTAPNAAPADVFNTSEHRQALASTYLQGLPTQEKIGVVTWNNSLPATAMFNEMKSYVFVNNPSPSRTLNVAIEYRDQVGNLVFTSNATIAPNGSHAENAVPIFNFGPNGHGIVRVVGATANDKFVGAIVKQSHRFFGFTPPNNVANALPNMVASEQLQAIGGATTLRWGPLPEDYQLTTPAFLHRLNYLFSVYNPSATTAANVTFSITSRNGNVVASAPITLPPFGSMVNADLFNFLMPRYVAPFAPAASDDWVVTVSSNKPIQGEGMMVSVFDPALPAKVGGRFRIETTMLASSSAKTLYNSELISEVNGSRTTTLIGLWNPTSSSIGPIRIQYLNRSGALVATDVISTFGPNAMARIGAGLAASPLFPSGQFAGSVRIHACVSGLVGWVMRPSESNTAGSEPEQFREVYGELLEGLTGSEPGAGTTVRSTGGVNRVRRIGPFGVVNIDAPVPSFSTAVNYNLSNLGTYVWLFHDFAGNALTNPPLTPFAGLSFGSSSFTYQDNIPSLVSSTFGAPVATSPKFESLLGPIRGITILGGRLHQFQFGNAEFESPPAAGGTYTGPGDTV